MDSAPSRVEVKVRGAGPGLPGCAPRGLQPWKAMYGGARAALRNFPHRPDAEYSRCPFAARRVAPAIASGRSGSVDARFCALCYKHTVFQPHVAREDLMQDTANVRRPPKPQAATDSIPSLAFADADGAKRWAKSLLITGVTPLYEAVRGQLRALSERRLLAARTGDASPKSCATRSRICTPSSRDATPASRSRPPSASSTRPSRRSRCGRALWEQYSACLKPLLEGDIELQGVKAKLLQRGLYVGKQLVIVMALPRRVPPPSLWQELHAYYRLAELLDCAGHRGVGRPAAARRRHLLLFDLLPRDPAGPRRSVQPVGAPDRARRSLARPVGAQDLSLFAAARDRGPGHPHGPRLVGAGRRLHPPRPRNAPASMRYGYPGKLATSVRGRMKRLAGGATPAELQLGHDTSLEGSAALLAHLDAHWYQLPLRAQEVHQQSIEITAGGVQAAYFRVGGRTFDRQDPLGRLDVPGRAAPADARRADRLRPLQGRRRAQLAVGAMAGRIQLAATRTSCAASATRYRWFLDQLVVVRDEERTRLGYVKRVAVDAAERARACRSRCGPASRSRIAVRPMSIAFAEELPLPALMSVGHRTRSLHRSSCRRALSTPDACFARWMADPSASFASPASPQRGGDFERVQFEEIVVGSTAQGCDARPPAARTIAYATTCQSSRRRDEPVPPAARRQSGRLVSVGRGSARQGARAKDKPILLSIGYSACHWCHVMAHESFEDADVADGDERRLRQHQGRSRGAARPRPDLPDRARAPDAAQRRLAADDVPDARRRAVLRRHLFPQARAARAARVCSICCPRSPRRIATSAPSSPSRAGASRAALQTLEPEGGRGAAAAASARPLRWPRSSARFDPVNGGFGGAPKFPHPFELRFCLDAWAARRRRERA